MSVSSSNGQCDAAGDVDSDQDGLSDAVDDDDDNDGIPDNRKCHSRRCLDIYITYTDEIDMCRYSNILSHVPPRRPDNTAQPEHLSLHCELDIPHKTFIILLCLKEVRNKVGIRIRRAFTEFNEALFPHSCVSEDDDDDGDGIADQDEDWDGDGLSNESADTRASHQSLQLQLHLLVESANWRFHI